MTRVFIDLYRSNLFKHILYYGMFHLLVWFFYLLLVSVIAFFHFMLKHHLSDVEDWLFIHGWEIVLITKLGAFFILLKFIYVKNSVRRPFRKLLSDGMLAPIKENFVVITFLLFFLVSLGYPIEAQESKAGLFGQIISLFGNFAFYMVDILFINALRNNYPLDATWKKRLELFLFPLIFFLVSKNIFLYETNMNEMVFFNAIFCLYLSDWKRSNWTYSALYLLLFSCPVSVIFGMDPIWGKTFSFLNMKFSVLEKILIPRETIYISLLIISLGYLFLKKKKSDFGHN